MKLIYSQNSNLNFDFDYAMFRYDSISNYCEVYYSFAQKDLTIHSIDSIKLVEAILHIDIQDTLTKQFIVSKEWKINNEVSEEPNESKNKLLIGLIGFNLPKGFYKCIVGGYDFVNKNKKKFFTEFIRAIPFKSNIVSISDIQFASKIIQESSNTESIFYKNKLEVTPVPNAVFGENQPVLFYYSEIYNLLKSTPSKNIKLNTLVYDGKGKVYLNKTKLLTSNIDSRVEIGAVNVNKFPSETYTLHMILYDSLTNLKVASAKKFYVYNPSIIDTLVNTGTRANVLASQFGVMNIEECNALFEKSKYISNSQEAEQYGMLSTLEGKREFLFKFWNLRDTEPETERNEFFIEYNQRIEIVNQRFGSMKREGWKTDRGRVYLLHGEPSEIERFPNQVDTKPYEIWYYNQLEGGVIFVFADLTGFSDYLLIHSTLRGELRDDQWIRRIATN